MPTADDVDLGYCYTLAPEEAIRYFESKGYVIGFNFHDIEPEAHAKAFTVAGVLKLDVLNDLRDGLQSVLDNGDTLAGFKKNMIPLLEQKGWIGKGLVADPETGELEGKQLTPRRLQTIFDTNIQSSYGAGRWAQQMENAGDRPFLERVAVMDTHTRPKHAALNGFTARIDDPCWDFMYPPDGYGCRCRTRARSADDVEKNGLTVQSSEGRLVDVQQMYGGREITVTGMTFPDGTVYTADAGFGFNPGKVAWQPVLEKYDWQSARQYVEGSLSGPDFARGVQNVAKLDAKQQYPLAVLSPSQRSATGTQLQEVAVTAPVMQKLAKAAPTPAQWQLISQTIQNAESITPSGSAWKFTQAQGDKWSVATVEDNALTDWSLQDNPED